MGSRPTLQQLAGALEAQGANQLGGALRHPIREGSILFARVAGRLGLGTCRTRATTFWGERMEVVLPEPVSLEVFRFGFFDRALTSILLSYLRPGWVFFDVGAHFGYFSLLASALVGQEGRVLSFEPSPGTFRILEQNLRSHPNVAAYPVALYERRGQASFSDFGARFSAYNSMFAPRLEERIRRRVRSVERIVETWSLDGFAAAHNVAPDFVKIDAESAEYAIVQGMKHTVEQYRPLISVEVGDFDLPSAPPSRAVVDLLVEHGYQVLECIGGDVRPHAPRERYAYENLLFVPRDRAREG